MNNGGLFAALALVAVGVGALLVAAGVLLYLYSIVSYTTPPPSP